MSPMPSRSAVPDKQYSALPVEAGTKVGELVYLRDGEEVGRVELTAGEDVAKANMDTMLRRMLAGWC